MEKGNTLKRDLSLWTLVIYYFSTIVGVGIFVVPLAAFKIAGPASIISWLIVFIFAYPFAIIFGKIAQKYKVSGSIQKFLSDVFGKKIGGSFAIFMVLSAMFGNAVLGFSASRYMLELLHLNWSVYYLGATLLLLPLLFNLMSIDTSSKIQAICLLSLVLFVLISVCASVPSFQTSNLTPFAPNGYWAIIPAVSLCFYSITGWENVDSMAEEVKDPVKVYNKAVKVALLVIFCFYSLLITAILLSLSYDEIMSTNTILTTLLNKVAGHWAGNIAAFIAIALLMIGANAWVFGTSRMIFALARDEFLPIKLAKISSFGIPYNAVLVQFIFYFLLSIALAEFDFKESALIEVTSLNYLLLYTAIFIAAAKEFKGRLQILSIIAICVTSFFLVNATTDYFGISLLAMAACLTFAISNKRNK